eukprot:6182038-Pleurochrysis_carterae.AAC.1
MEHARCTTRTYRPVPKERRSRSKRKHQSRPNRKLNGKQRDGTAQPVAQRGVTRGEFEGVVRACRSSCGGGSCGVNRTPKCAPIAQTADIARVMGVVPTEPPVSSSLAPARAASPRDVPPVPKTGMPMATAAASDALVE